jgi:hypothetical protein
MVIAEREISARPDETVANGHHRYSMGLEPERGHAGVSTHNGNVERYLSRVETTVAGGFVIEPATGVMGAIEAACVRDEVFGREWKLRIPAISVGDGTDSLTLIARSVHGSEPVAVLTVVETTNDRELQRRLGLSFPPGARTARYTQLAVLKPFRGLNLPVRMVAEAHRRFVVPHQIRYTWLLFNADRAASSSFCRLLGFRAAPGTISTEYGRSRVLIHSEEVRPNEPAQYTNGNGAEPESGVTNLDPDEWVAQ